MNFLFTCGLGLLNKFYHVKKICCGLLKTGNFRAKRQNSTHLPDMDFLENDARDTEFLCKFIYFVKFTDLWHSSPVVL